MSQEETGSREKKQEKLKTSLQLYKAGEETSKSKGQVKQNNEFLNPKLSFFFTQL